MSPEPLQLKQGKKFHKLIQKEWLETVKDGLVHRERSVKKVNGRNGRVDILIEELGDFVSIIEIKATNWDRIKSQNIKRNARRQIRQIWHYIDSQLLGLGDDAKKDVCPGIIFPRRPQNSALQELIENFFNEEGIQVVWHDES